MKLTAKTDLEAPAAFVHAQLCDHPAWEREATRKGADVERLADRPRTGAGAAWRITGPFQGKVRTIVLTLDRIEPDSLLCYSFDGQMTQGAAELEVSALSARRSRLRVALEVKPKTLAGRVFFGTLRLAKGRLQARLDKGLARFARQLEIAHAEERARTRQG